MDKLIGARSRPDPSKHLIANAGRGLGEAFLDQDWAEARRVVDTNVIGTIYLIQNIAPAHAPSRKGPHPDHRLDRRIHAGQLPGGLQRHQGVPGFLFLCLARRD